MMELHQWNYAEGWVSDSSKGSFLLEATLFSEKEKKLEQSNPDSSELTRAFDSYFDSDEIVWRNIPENHYSDDFSFFRNMKSVFEIPVFDNKAKKCVLLFYSLEGVQENLVEFIHYAEFIKKNLWRIIESKKNKQLLIENESLLRQILKNMPVLFMETDHLISPISWNTECENVFGYKENEVIGKEQFLIKNLLNPQMNHFSPRVDSRIFDSDFKNWELDLFAKNGKSKTISLSNLSSEFPVSGLRKWFIGIDITRTKEIERELKSSLKELSDFQTALNTVSIVAITDKAGTIIYVNQNFCKISGYSRDELLGHNHRIINSGYHSKDFFKDLWKTISQGKIWKGEIKNKAKDGRFYWVDTTISPIMDENGKPYQYLAIRNDITERKETEEKARHAENNLKILQDRMSPHFLFNTLSIIHSYLQTNPEMADSAILMLADNYRFLTDQANKQLVPFDIEWEFMENYLKLLRLRFSDFIEIEVNKKGDFRKCQLPPLSLQPLVENSYLHGLRNKKGKGLISVNAYIEGTKTHIIIRDNGVGIKAEDTYSRSISNISERLKFYLYESEVKIENHPEGGAVVTVSFEKPKNEELSHLIQND
ncbi:PAS domain S-box protein [Leptospira kobayashii]|nr:PAS domain S-box protein [Leptospira kobayashii]